MFANGFIKKTEDIFALFDFIDATASTKHFNVARRLRKEPDSKNPFELDDMIPMWNRDGVLMYTIESNESKLKSIVHGKSHSEDPYEKITKDP